MDTTPILPFRKGTIIPLPTVDYELELPSPVQVADALTFEDVSGFLTPELFDLWRDLVSKRERDDLARVRFALIHRFQSMSHVGREEAESDGFAFQVFLCLSLIKPTRTSFQRIQVKFVEGNKAEVFSFQHPQSPPNVPDAESLNHVVLNDIGRLGRLLPSFRDMVAKGPENIRRAVRHFNVGYNEVRDPTVQIVVWMMGIESLFSSENVVLSRDELIRSVSNAIGLNRSIYEDSAMQEYIGTPTFTLGDLIGDLVSLRNAMAHGQGIPSEWKSKHGRNGLSGGIMYADVLREASSFILRKGILQYLEQHGVVTERP